MRQLVGMVLLWLLTSLPAMAAEPVLAIYPFTTGGVVEPVGRDLAGALSAVVAARGGMAVVERAELATLEAELERGGSAAGLRVADLVLSGTLDCGSDDSCVAEARLVDLRRRTRVTRVVARNDSPAALAEDLVAGLAEVVELFSAYRENLDQGTAGPVPSAVAGELPAAREVDLNYRGEDALDRQVRRDVERNRLAQGAGFKAFTGVPLFGPMAEMALGGELGRTARRHLRPSTLSFAAGIASGLLSWMFFDGGSDRGGGLTAGFSLFFFYNGYRLRVAENRRARLESLHGGADQEERGSER